MATVDASALTVDSTETYRRHVESAAAFLEEIASPMPSVGILLDPALSGLGDALLTGEEVPVDQIPQFPVGEGAWERRFGIGRFDEARAAVLDGTLSLHEGHTPREVTFPVRAFGAAGVDTLLIINVVGSLRSGISPSDLVLLADHINFQGANPLVGPNVEEWGPRFPDMTEPYSAALRQTAEQAARSLGISLGQGIYFATLGPQMSTQTEYRMAKSLGADLVGTSAVPEVIAARHMSIDVLTISVVTHRCIPIGSASDSSSDREAAVESVRSDAQSLVRGTLAGMKSEEKPV